MRSLAAPPVVFRLPALPNSVCCLVRAWPRYAATAQGNPENPAFIMPSGLPLPAKTLLRALKIVSLTVFSADKGYTLHSLCSGPVQACQGVGLSLDNIMTVGMWRSNAVNTYLQALHISSASAVLGDLLG